MTDAELQQKLHWEKRNDVERSMQYIGSYICTLESGAATMTAGEASLVGQWAGRLLACAMRGSYQPPMQFQGYTFEDRLARVEAALRKDEVIP